MSQTFDCTSEEGRTAGIEAAVAAVRDHEIVVLPTDTVYGVGADAFSPDAVRAVLDAKGRGADMPPPVLIPHARTADGLATQMPAYARDLMDAFWPGPLTLVLLAQPSLMWDLGDTNGTVALRVPEDPVALELLMQIGPMAVTSANLTGRPAALTAREAMLMLGDSVSVYLDGGPSAGGEASTILDCTQEQPRILREGAIAVDRLEEVLGDVTIEGRGPSAAPVVDGSGDDASAPDVPTTAGGEPRSAGSAGLASGAAAAAAASVVGGSSHDDVPSPRQDADDATQSWPRVAQDRPSDPVDGHAAPTMLLPVLPDDAEQDGARPPAAGVPHGYGPDGSDLVPRDTDATRPGAGATGGRGLGPVDHAPDDDMDDDMDDAMDDDGDEPVVAATEGTAYVPRHAHVDLPDPDTQHIPEDPHRDAPGLAIDPNL